MQCYVINLESEPERLTHMATQFKRLGVDWTRLAAIDARQWPEDVLTAFRADRRHSSRPHAWSAGQAGALSSHMEAWRRIGESDARWGAVFEDDVDIDIKVAPLLRDDRWLPEGVDIIRLETTLQGMRLGRTNHRLVGSCFELLQLRAEAWGAAGYLIERKVARWLACTPPRLQAPADWLLFHGSSTIACRLAVLQFSPAPCIQDQFNPSSQERHGFVSTTEDTPRRRKGQWNVLRGKLAATGRRFIGKQLIGFSGDPSKRA